jgi:hypothetical protein
MRFRAMLPLLLYRSYGCSACLSQKTLCLQTTNQSTGNSTRGREPDCVVGMHPTETWSQPKRGMSLIKLWVVWRLGPATTLYELLPSPLSSRLLRRAVEPERSGAKGPAVLRTPLADALPSFPPTNYKEN